MRTNEGEAETPFAATLERGLNILASYRPEDIWLTNLEIATRTGIPKSSVSRLTSTLVGLGYLSRDQKGRYRVGSRVLAVAYPLLARFRIRQIARPFMREFAENAGGTVSIGLANGTDAVLLEVARSANSVTTPYVSEIGFSISLCRTAIGRAIMSLMTEAELEDVYVQTSRIDEQSATIRLEVEQSIHECREKGYCVLSTWRPETLATGAPLLRTPEGDCLGLVCAVPAFRSTEKDMADEIGPRLVSLAQTIKSMAGT